MRKYAMLAAVAIVCAAGCSSNVYQVRTDTSMFLRATQGQKVYVKVTNMTTLKNFPLESDVVARLQNKGYQVVDRPDGADFVLQASVTQADLKEEEVTGKGAATGAVVGGVAGALGGASTHHHRHHYRWGNVWGGAFFGAILGAVLGHWIETEEAQTIFTMTVQVQVEEKATNKVHNANVNVEVREKTLTLEGVSARVRADVADQIAGQF